MTVGRNSGLVNYLHSLGVLPYVQICLWSSAELTELRAVPGKWICKEENQSVAFESQSSLVSVACELGREKKKIRIEKEKGILLSELK